MLLLCPVLIYGQQKPVVPHGFPPPLNQPKKKKDTTKPSPYLADTLLHSIPFNHFYIHDKIDKELKKADMWDGVADSAIHISTDSLLSTQLSDALLKDVAKLKVFIENMPIASGRDSIMENQHKIRCLTAVWEMLRSFNNDPKPDAVYYINLVANMRGMIKASNENKLMEFAKVNTNIYTLDNGKVLMDNQPEVRAYIYTEIGAKYPTMMIKRLGEYATDTFASAIISADARIEPELIFNYATSTNYVIRGAIHRTKDPLVHAIVKIADGSKSPLKSLSFLGDIYSGRKSIAAIDSITRNADMYYKNLVRLKIEDDSIARYSYTRDLSYRTLQYVRKMNELHEAKDDVRFKCIDSLQPAELYYLIVYGQDEIYTSSYIGTFKRLLERMKPMKGDKLLDTLNYDHFRTFIRMSAGYNTLSSFLATIDDTARATLMNKFISGLQKGKAEELEDAVDVADAFGSIKDSALSVFLESKVKENYELSYKMKSKKGMIIYSLLSRLFEGNKITDNDTGATVASERLHLPPINRVLNKDLVNDSGIIYQQVFFFGDDDGEKSYRSFLSGYKDEKKWRIDTTQYWTAISSIAGKKVVLYANRPLQAPDDEDAQNRLTKYLEDSGIHPSIVIHRGHSYHLPLTLTKLNNKVKIVILGSCGGYHNLAIVLDHAPDAHIVSSKQTGTMGVNDPIINAMNKRLLDGSDVNWIDIWNELDTYFATKPEFKEKFADYVPPYKNLGAIFIKAYRKISGGK